MTAGEARRTPTDATKMNRSASRLMHGMNTDYTLVPDFAPYFSSTRIDSSDSAAMRAAYQLRYEVYCLECGFLPAQQFPDGLETDDRDAQAAHFGAFNRAGELVGYVRLLRPDVHLRLPFQAYCPDWLPGCTMPPATDSAEISRLMVRKDYRRRNGDLLAGVSLLANPTETGATAAATDERRNPSPQIMLSLYREIFRHSLDAGLQHWFAAMEKPLARVLARMGFAFHQVCRQADYFGPVAPYRADLQDLQASVGAANPQLLRWLLPLPAATP